MLPARYSCSVPYRGTRRPPPNCPGRLVGSLLQLSLRDTIPRGGRKCRLEDPPLVPKCLSTSSPVFQVKSPNKVPVVIVATFP